MKYSLFPIAFLACVTFAQAATWCTTYACFVSRTTALSSGCIFRCEAVPAATIPLGDEELQRACTITEVQQPYCPISLTNTTTTTTASGSTATTSSTTAATEALLNSLTQQTAAQTERAYQNAYEQFLADLNSTQTSIVTTSNIQTSTISEVPWRDMFRVGTTTQNTTTQLRTDTTASATKPVCADTFSRNFRLGMSHEEVKLIQRFLNAQTDTIVAASGEQSKGKETTSFNARTVSAVKKFQQKYAADVLAPVNEPQPTGFWGPFTRRKANELVCAGTVKIESQ